MQNTFNYDKQFKTTFPFAALLLNQLEDAAFCLDINAQILYANPTFCCLSGFSFDELLFSSWYDIEQELSPQLWAEQWQVLKQQRCLNKVSCYRTKSNQVLSVEAKITYLDQQGYELICIFIREAANQILLAENSNPVASESVAQPLSTVVIDQNTAKLEASLALLNATLESTAIGIVAIGNEATAFYFNQIFAEMWQLPDSVVITRDCERAKAFFERQVKDPEVFRKAFWEVSSQAEYESYDVLELKDDRTFAHYAKPQRLNDKIIGRVWSIWDVTKFKQAEAALQDDPLWDTQTQQSKHLVELKAQFISVICHQFRSLLNIISFSNSLLRRNVYQWTDDKRQPYLEHIQAAVEQITQLLDEILLFGKSTTGKLEPELKRLNLEVVCQELVTQLQPISDASQQAIVFSSQGNSWVKADAKLLQPMLINLLSNAIKYSPAGSTIHFELACYENSARFQIQDSGIGISAADQLRLCEPFYRGSNVGNIPGTGLGLATVKNLVELQNGQISITSEVGVGTTVVITLPLQQSYGDL